MCLSPWLTPSRYSLSFLSCGRGELAQCESHSIVISFYQGMGQRVVSKSTGRPDRSDLAVPGLYAFAAEQHIPPVCQGLWPGAVLRAWLHGGVPLNM